MKITKNNILMNKFVELVKRRNEHGNHRVMLKTKF